MSFPTVLGPWYVVQRHVGHDQNDASAYTEYYTSMEDGGAEFQEDKKRAMLFMSLGSAARIANDTVAEIRVLTTEADAKEFDRA